MLADGVNPNHAVKELMAAERTVRCPVAHTLDIVGDRWTLLVVRDMLRGHRRFSELRDSVEGITPGILSNRLKLLEREDIVRRELYSDHPPRAEYHLTRKGHELGVIVGALSNWGEQYADADLTIVDNDCGHGVELVYHCPTCDREAPRSRLRIVHAEG
jgi:DNA-binding HxlR family transcriptional regulator